MTTENFLHVGTTKLLEWMAQMSIKFLANECACKRMDLKTVFTLLIFQTHLHPVELIVFNSI